METVKVLSPVQDKKIREDLNGSPIWKQAYHIDELTVAEKNHAELYEYSFKFEGLKVVQLTGVKKLAK
jgi:hypothetical protein